MDNLSHSFAGLVLGELADRSLAAQPDPAQARARRRLLLVTGWAANNFPDLDLVLTPLAPAPLGYLLHHRGHTHTLLYALPQALLLLALLWLLWPAARRLLREDRRVRWATAALAVLGMGLHLSMDFLNVYGIHPFHPFDARWVYGDMVFIVEPAFWVAFGAPLALLAEGRARWVLLGVLALVPAWFTVQGFLQWGSLGGLLALGAALAALQLRSGERGRAGLAAACAAAAGFVGVQALAAGSARERLAIELAGPGAPDRLHDIALSALPANPLCWTFVTVESNEATGAYRVRRGSLSLAPGITPVSHCPARFTGLSRTPDSAAVAVQWEQAGRLEELRELYRSDCRVNAWLRFARTPALHDGTATDVRFGAPGSGNFTTLRYAAQAGSRCPRGVPQWGYPRADLLARDQGRKASAAPD